MFQRMLNNTVLLFFFSLSPKIPLIKYTLKLRVFELIKSKLQSKSNENKFFKQNKCRR